MGGIPTQGTFWWLSAKTGNKLQKAALAAFLFLGYGYLHEASGLITFCIIALACTKEKEAI